MTGANSPAPRRARVRGIGSRWLLLLLWVGAPAWAVPGQPSPPAATAQRSAVYTWASPSSPDGTGKFYQGREIARVMSHQGAWWLERPEREREEQPAKVVAALELRPGMWVADLGAGTGYYTRRLAKAVQPGGRVFAVDVQPEMLDILRERADQAGLTNIVTVLATEKDPRLPKERLDLVVMVDVYHELLWPHEVLEAVRESLKPGGRVAFVEYRAEDPAVPIKPLHKMTEAQVRREAAVHRFEWIRTVDTLPWQHLILFRRPAEKEVRAP